MNVKSYSIVSQCPGSHVWRFFVLAVTLHRIVYPIARLAEIARYVLSNGSRQPISQQCQIAVRTVSQVFAYSLLPKASNLGTFLYHQPVMECNQICLSIHTFHMIEDTPRENSSHTRPRHQAVSQKTYNVSNSYNFKEIKNIQ